LVNFGCAKNPVIIGKHLSESGKIAAKKRVEHITKLQNMKMHLTDVPITVRQNMRQKLLEIKTKKES